MLWGMRGFAQHETLVRVWGKVLEDSLWVKFLGGQRRCRYDDERRETCDAHEKAMNAIDGCLKPGDCADGAV